MLRQAATALLQGGASSVLPALGAALPALSRQLRGLQWSVEREPAKYKDVSEIIQHDKIESLLESTKPAATDIGRVRAILQAARDRSFLTHREPGAGGAGAQAPEWGGRVPSWTAPAAGRGAGGVQCGARALLSADGTIWPYAQSPPDSCTAAASLGPPAASAGGSVRLAPACQGSLHHTAPHPAAHRVCSNPPQLPTHTHTQIPFAGPSEYVQGLTYEECATLLNVDANDAAIMDEIYDTAFQIKERIYGNRIVLFAPLYLASELGTARRACVCFGGGVGWAWSGVGQGGGQRSQAALGGYGSHSCGLAQPACA